MTIYAEYLFIENFIAGIGILKLTALLCGRVIRWFRAAAGGVLCGIFSFIILLNLPAAAVLIYEILFVFSVVMISFGPVRFQALVKMGAVFYCISFLLGGAALAVIFMSGTGGAVNNGFFYINRGGYLTVAAGAAAGTFMILSVIRFVRKKSRTGSEVFDLTVSLLGRKMDCIGKVDSGNFLREPLSGRPVSLISSREAEKNWGDLYENDLFLSRVRAVPCRSVGCDGSILMAVRCDSLTVHGEGIFGRRKIVAENVFMGIYDGDFSAEADETPFSVLLQPSVIYEGGAHQ